MKDTRTKRASLNIIFLLMYEVAVFICNMILPKMIISTYGSEYNGLISSVTQFLNFVSILRLGVAGATRVGLYKSLADDDIAETSAILKATQNYMRKIGYVILIYVAVLAVAFPLGINNSFGFWDTAILVIAIGLGTFAQYFYGITYRTLLQADQKLYINNIVQTITVVLNTVISAVLIINGFSIQVVKMCTAFLYILSPMILNRYVIWSYGIDTKCAPDDSALKKKGDAMGHSIANIVHENTDVIVLTLFTSLSTVSVYTVYNLVMSGIKQIMNVFTTGLEAVFGSMWAKGEDDKLRRNLSYFEYMISVFIIIVFSVTIILIIPFVRLYTKGVTDVEYIVPVYALIIIIAQMFYCFRMPYLTVVQATGHYKETKHGAYFEAALNLGVSLIMVQFCGMIGTALGTLLANLFRTIQYSLYVSNHLVVRKKTTILYRLVWIGLNVIISCMVCTFIGRNINIDSWVSWVGCGVLYVLVAVCVCVISSAIFYREDMKGLLNLGKRMIKWR